jgi:hypothetical protein
MVVDNIMEYKKNKRIARIAGLYYFVFIMLSVLAERFGHIGFGDIPTIYNTIINNNGLFRIGFILGLFSAVFFFLAAWFLYVLLKPINKNIALLFVLLNFGGVIIQCLSILNLIGSMTLLSGVNYLQGLQPEQLQSQAMIFTNLYKDGFEIAQIFYGAWVFPLGYLIYKIKIYPKNHWHIINF